MSEQSYLQRLAAGEKDLKGNPVLSVMVLVDMLHIISCKWLLYSNILCLFQDITTFTVYATVPNSEKPSQSRLDTTVVVIMSYRPHIIRSSIRMRWRGSATSSVGLAISRSRVQILLEATLRNNLRQVVDTYVCASVTKQYNLVPAKGR